jgi:hypothetical protein
MRAAVVRSSRRQRATADPTRPITSFKTAWIKVRQKAGVKGRWHDNRHTLVTELAESGAGDEVIMSIAGLVSRAMLSRYSHVRMEAKRRALDEIAPRQRAADDRRREEKAATAGCDGLPISGNGPVIASTPTGHIYGRSPSSLGLFPCGPSSGSSRRGHDGIINPPRCRTDYSAALPRTTSVLPRILGLLELT